MDEILRIRNFEGEPEIRDGMLFEVAQMNEMGGYVDVIENILGFLPSPCHLFTTERAWRRASQWLIPAKSEG